MTTLRVGTIMDTKPTSATALRSRRWRWLGGVLGTTLVALLMYGLYWAQVLRYHQTTDDAYVGGNVVQITLFESAMGPMIGASIVAIQHGLNPPLITLLVGIGITASFLSLPLWWYVLQGV